MRALRQGELDALCGVYALINAIEIAGVTGPRSELHRRLFRRLTVGLPCDRLQSAMHLGLDAEDLLTTGERAFKWLRRSYGLTLSLSQPLSTEDSDDLATFIEAVKGWTERSDMAVIVNVHLPGLSHWTVVKRIRNKTMEVRDSGRLKTLSLERFSLTRGRFRFSADQTLLLRFAGSTDRARRLR